MPQNVEIKARVESLDEIRRLVIDAVTEDLGVQQQIDTYYRTGNGRLKLRQINNAQEELIWYLRPSDKNVRISEYTIVQPIPPGLTSILESALGIQTQVEKSRQILLHHNVRIHLDEVKWLGKFVELEGVIDENNDESVSRERVNSLCKSMQLAPTQYVKTSYRELMLGIDDSSNTL